MSKNEDLDASVIVIITQRLSGFTAEISNLTTLEFCDLVQVLKL